VKPIYFWSSAAAAGVILGGAIALLFPYGALGIEPGAERQQAWLLTVWTAGVLAICFGGTGLLALYSPISFRDVAEAGSVAAAIETHRELRSQRGESPFYNFAGWTVSAGAVLILLYFAGWLVLG
jgi:hypothetical protein